MRRATTYSALAVLAAAVAVVPSQPAQADDIRDHQWMVEALDLESAHRVSTGEGATIGLVDTGVNAEHPDLVGNVDPGMATWEGGEDGLVDVYGHGTAMASLAVGHGHGDDNGDGVLGVAPNARILSAGVMSIDSVEIADEGGSWFGDDDIAPAVRWLADNGADVILMSISGDFGPSVRDAVEYAAGEKGIPVIACSGNVETHGTDVRAPAMYEDALAVAGTDETGAAWDGAIIGPKVELSAPAAHMYVADFDGDGYETYYGTSNSAAVVAGVAALMLSLWPDMSREVLQWRLTQTADDRGEPGRDEEYGYGVVDPTAALTEIVAPLPGDPTADVNPAPVGSSLTATPRSVDEWTALVVGAGAVVIVAWLCGWIIWSSRRRRASLAASAVSPAPNRSTVVTDPGPEPDPDLPPGEGPRLAGPQKWE